jgi:putative nucleotidyltransferase with HDIG domain/PAS domain S-box-containing protein
MPSDLKVLIVEDSEDDAELILRELRRGGYAPNYLRVASQAAMMDALDTRQWDIILSDFALPGFSGVGALTVWKSLDLDIPFIVISGTIGEETAVTMMKAGASDYLMKQNMARLNAAIERELRETQVRRQRREAEKSLRDSELRFSLFMNNYPGLVYIQNPSGEIVYVNQRYKETFPDHAWIGEKARDLLPQDWADLLTLGDPQALSGEIIRAVNEVTGVGGDAASATGGSHWFEMVKFLIPREGTPPLIGVQALDVSERMRAENELLRAKQDLEKAYEETLEGWARALEMHERETLGHSRRVVNLAVELAQEMGIPQGEMEYIRWGALLHDIGKMAVPVSILNKPGPLTPDEWNLVREHPVKAYQLLYPIEYLRPAVVIPHRHHEKWDGSGYPDALMGAEIPLPARIFAVVDVYVALCEKRSYSDAWPELNALDYIREQAGQHFDPQVVDAFVRVQARKNLK